MDIKTEAQSIQGKILKWRRDLHQIPELGLELPKTQKYVKEELIKIGVSNIKSIAKTGLTAEIEGSNDGKTILLRADMDGLPIKEETGLEFASKNGNMHACGHDAHTAMLLGATHILMNRKDDIKGNVKLAFQPGEEEPGGAKPMIEEGILESPKVDAAIGLHIGGIVDVGTGQIGVSYGPTMASIDRFKMKIVGKGGHGAMPHNTVDPIVIASNIINGIQTIISRNLDPVDSGVVTIGKIEGGSSYNIIPEDVTILGSIRARTEESRNFIIERVKNISEDIASALGGKIIFELDEGYPPLITDINFTKDFVDIAKNILPNEDIIEIKEPIMGSEDMAYFLREVPGTFFFLGSMNEEKGIVYPHHNPKFDIDEDVLWIGSALLAETAINWLKNN